MPDIGDFICRSRRKSQSPHRAHLAIYTNRRVKSLGVSPALGLSAVELSSLEVNFKVKLRFGTSDSLTSPSNLKYGKGDKFYQNIKVQYRAIFSPSGSEICPIAAQWKERKC